MSVEIDELRERASFEIDMIVARYDGGALPPGIAALVRRLRRIVEAPTTLV
jgi:hypothetical protein